MSKETGEMDQCKQTVRAGHRCPRAAKRDGFCDAHWLMRFGHQWETPALVCAWCKEHWQPSTRSTCLLSPYVDQPPSVYPEPIRNGVADAK
jgi:hypothetical protein